MQSYVQLLLGGARVYECEIVAGRELYLYNHGEHPCCSAVRPLSGLAVLGSSVLR